MPWNIWFVCVCVCVSAPYFSFRSSLSSICVSHTCIFYSTCIEFIEKFIVPVSACSPSRSFSVFHSILCSLRCIQYFNTRIRVFTRARTYTCIQHVRSLGQSRSHTVCTELPMVICFRQRQNHHFIREKYVLTTLRAAAAAATEQKNEKIFYEELELYNQVSVRLSWMGKLN